jgi:RNA-directed DNA polymerase
MRGGGKETLKKGKQVVARRELKLHEEKSRVVDAREGSFDFLGFTFARKRSPKTARVITWVKPSRKSEQQLRDEVRGLTSRRSHSRPQQAVVARVNRYVRGWVNYFHVHNSTRVFARHRFFFEQRMRKYLQKRRQSKGFGYRRWPASRLYREWGLYAIPVQAPYGRARMP